MYIQTPYYTLMYFYAPTVYGYPHDRPHHDRPHPHHFRPSW